MKIVIAGILGLVLGFAGGVVPRIWKVDPLRLFAALAPERGPLDGTPAVKEADAAGAAKPVESDLQGLIADVRKQRAALDAREKPLAARELQVQQERAALMALKQQM